MFGLTLLFTNTFREDLAKYCHQHSQNACLVHSIAPRLHALWEAETMWSLKAVHSR